MPRWLMLLLYLSWAGTASASASFPKVVQQEYGLPEEPPCVLCHASEEGGARTATKPFAVTLSRHGVDGGKPGTLSAALREIERNPTDSDGDGYGDHDELVAGLDPNDAGDGPGGGLVGPPPYSGPLPRHGCAMGDDRAFPLAWTLVALLLAASGARRYWQTTSVAQRRRCSTTTH